MESQLNKEEIIMEIQSKTKQNVTLICYKEIDEIINTLKKSIEELKLNEEKEDKRCHMYINGICAGTVKTFSYSLRHSVRWFDPDCVVPRMTTVTCDLVGTRFTENAEKILSANPVLAQFSIVGELSDGKVFCMKLPQPTVLSWDEYTTHLSADSLEIIDL